MELNVTTDTNIRSNVTTPSVMDTNATYPSLSLIQIFSGLLVLLLQLGLQLVEAGSVRSKNTAAVFMRGLACLTISVVLSWVCGYSFTFSSGHFLIGLDSNVFGLHHVQDSVQAHWFLHAAVASLPSTLIAASMSERSHLTGHMVLAIFLAAVVYPLPAHWIWHEEGWLHLKGCRDVGGVITVHIIGGVGALVGSLLVGPRVERIGDKYRDNSLTGHSLPLVAVGGMMVLVGMVAKVVGLANSHDQIGQLAANSLLGGAGGGVVAMSLFKLTVKRTVKYNVSRQTTQDSSKNMSMANRRWSYLTAYNGVLTGMVCVCGVGSSLPTWAALVSGLIGGVAFFMLSLLLRMNKVDDPVSGVAVNISGGVVGALVTGLAHMVQTHDGMVVGWQLVAVVVVAAWVIILCLMIMLPLMICGKLRIKDSQEKLGIDSVKVLEQAYSIPEVVGKSLSKEISHQVGLCMVPERERSPICAFVSPNIRDEKMPGNTCLTENVVLEGKVGAPKIVLESPAASLQNVTPAPPSYLSNESLRPAEAETSLTVPEISVTVSNTSDNSQTPLLATSGTSPASNLLAVDVKELRAALRQQKERLKNTNSSMGSSICKDPVPCEDGNELNISNSSAFSESSVKSEVYRQAAKTASNKENFNYLAGSRKLHSDLDGLDTNETENRENFNASVPHNESTTVAEKDFDYSKKDIDDGLAQESHVEVKEEGLEDNVLCGSIVFLSEDEGIIGEVRESGPF